MRGRLWCSSRWTSGSSASCAAALQSSTRPPWRELSAAAATPRQRRRSTGELWRRRRVDFETVSPALVACQRYAQSGILVAEDGRLAGAVGREDLDKAVAHGLSHAPVKGIM